MKKKLMILPLLTALLICGCSREESFMKPYSADGSESDLRADYGISETLGSVSDNKVIIEDDSAYPLDGIEAPEALLFSLDTKDIVLAKNAYGEFGLDLMTKLIAADYACCNYDIYDKFMVPGDIYSVNSNLLSCHFTKGDVIRIRDILYCYVMYCANDVSIPLAFYQSGSISQYAEEVNQYIQQFGTKKTKIVNLTGESNPDQITTIYDLYLILPEILSNATMAEILSSASFQCSYTANNGSAAGFSVQNALPYFNGVQTSAPVTVTGGMCINSAYGTNQMLVLAKNQKDENFVAFVNGCTSSENLLEQMEQILQKIPN